MRSRAGKWEIGSAVVSLCSLLALFTNQGSSAMLIERLPASVQSAQWTTTMVRVWAATTSVTMVVTAVGVPVLLTLPRLPLVLQLNVPDTARCVRRRRMQFA
jgi:hypothetical protein